MFRIIAYSIKKGSIQYMFIHVLLSINVLLSGQELQETWELTFEEIAESLTSQMEMQIDYTSLYEQLLFLRENQVHINIATPEELNRLIMLTDFQAVSLYNYIRDHGPVLSEFELPYVYGFSEKTVALVLPFINFSKTVTKERISIKKTLGRGKHQLFLRGQGILELQKGYINKPDSSGLPGDPAYLGSPVKFYTRYGFSFNNRIQMGITAEKDQGETFFKKPNGYGYDFYSGFILIRSLWKFKSIIAGDYEPRFGQGLTLWSGLSFGKSPEILLIEKRENRIRKYTSTNENMFFRGVAATIDLGMPEITFFFSSKKIDANILSPDSVIRKDPGVSSMLETGIHATSTQIEDRRVLPETLYGMNVSFRKNNFTVGGTYLGFQYGYPVAEGKQPYEMFDFVGKRGQKAGLDYKYVFNKGALFGEVSHSFGKGWATLQGGHFYISEEVTLSVLYRYYARDFIPLYSQAFGENSKNQNENGWYTGVRISPFRNWSFSGYVDIFNFPWLKWSTNAPSNGWEYLLQADFNPDEKIGMYWRVRKKQKQINLDDALSIARQSDCQKLWIRYQVAYRAGSSLEFRNRVEWVGYKTETGREQGYLIYQDVLYRPQAFPLDLSFRFALFETDSYDTRLYAYENDVLYAFSIPPYFGRGTKIYLMAHTELMNHVDIWIRLARTGYDDREEVGSGLDAIHGSHKTELKIQVRLKF